MYSIECSLTQEFLIAEATDEVIVHQSSRLHVRIRDCWPDEAESPQLEILAQCLGFGGSRWNLSRSLPAAEFGLPADEPPAVGVKAAELFLDFEKRTSIAHRGLDLHAVADNLRISQKAPGFVSRNSALPSRDRSCRTPADNLPASSAQATSSVRPARLRARGPRSVWGRYERERPTRDRDIQAITD